MSMKLKSFTIWTAKAGETWLPNWKPVGSITATSPTAAAKKHLRNPRRIATQRFTTGEHDYIFSPS